MANRAKTKRISGSAYLRIGEIADRTNVTERTLRFYEEKGLLKPPSRMDGGFRLYSDEDIARVERIKDLQKHLGLSLAEIKEMVEDEEAMMQLRAGYRPEASLKEKRADALRAIDVMNRERAVIQAKIDALVEMKSHLEEQLATHRIYLEQIESGLSQEKASRRRSKDGSRSG